ncbi:MAG: flippase [Acidobacteriota bacterium]|nr:flippase [Acidobacteriota bacterium]
MIRHARHPVVRNALALYGIQVANYVLPLFTFPYLARILHPDKFGLIAYSQAFVQYFATITEYGFGFSATRQVAIHRNDPDKLSRIFTAVMAAKLILMMGSFAIMTAVVFATPKLREEWPLYYITFLTVLGSFLFPVWLFMGLEKMQYITMREVGTRMLALLPIFIFVHRESDYLIAAGIQSGSMALAGLAGLIAVPKATRVKFVKISRADIAEAFADGWHYFLSTAAITLYTTSNIVVLGFVASRESVGYYAAAKRLIDAAKSLVSPISTALFPHVSRLAAESRAGALEFIQKNILRLSLPFVLISGGLLVAAPLVLSLAGGKRFSNPESILILRIMAPIPCVLAFAHSYATYFMLGLGYKKEWTRMIVMAGALNFVVLIPLLFITSPAIAVAITGTSIEVFVLARSYVFYRSRHADR